MSDDLAQLVKRAEGAVSGVSDKAIKVKAFELVMQELLQRDRQSTAGGPPSQRSKSIAGPPRLQRRLPRVTRGGLTQRILELIDEGALKTPQTRAEIKTELQQRGHHYEEDTIGMALLRLVRRRVLRRVPKTKGKNPIYVYVVS